MTEAWRSIPENGRYEASSLGRIRRAGGKVLKPCVVSGYEAVRFGGRKDGRRYKVHRLVLSAFVRQPLPGEVCNHKNGSKRDNRVENLEWCTCGENLRHAYAIGLKARPFGRRSASAKLTAEQAADIRSRCPRAARQRDHLGRLIATDATRNKIAIAREYGISQATIDRVLRGASWPAADDSATGGAA